jgi:acyl dehydratase
MIDKSRIGEEIPLPPWEVEAGKMREFVQAIGDDNPIFLSKEEAIKRGYIDIPAPCTFVTVLMNWTGVVKSVLTSLGTGAVVHGEEEYEYLNQIYPGDVLNGNTKVVSVLEKAGKSGVMNFITVETEFNNQNNEKVIKVRSLLIERP